MKTKILFLLFIFTSLRLFSQSNEKISSILSSEKVTYGEVCYLVATAQGFVDDDASYEQAIQVLYDKGQMKSIVYKNEYIPLVNVTFLFSQLWDIKGGIMCRLTNNSPRYVFKQLKSDGVIESSKDSSSFVSGRYALSLYTTCLYYYGNQELKLE